MSNPNNDPARALVRKNSSLFINTLLLRSDHAITAEQYRRIRAGGVKIMMDSNKGDIGDG